MFDPLPIDHNVATHIPRIRKRVHISTNSVPIGIIVRVIWTGIAYIAQSVCIQVRHPSSFLKIP